MESKIQEMAGMERITEQIKCFANKCVCCENKTISRMMKLITIYTCSSNCRPMFQWGLHTSEI
jgi:hypothetical protein